MTILTLAVSPSARAIDRIDMDYDRSPRLMPYQVDTTWFWTYESKVKHRQIAVLQPIEQGRDTAYLAYAYNPPPERDQPSAVNTIHFPPDGGELFDEQPVPIFISDLSTYYDHRFGRNGLLVSGYRHDSAFVIATDPYTEERRSCYIGSGVDETENGWWNGTPIVFLADDLDDDGIEEAYVAVQTGRDANGRCVASINLDDMSLRWRVPLPVNVDAILPIQSGDSVSIVCLTQAPGQGAGDSLFDDTHAYLMNFSLDGRLRWYRTIGWYPFGSLLAAGPGDSTLVLVQELPYGTLLDSGDERQTVRNLSLIDGEGRLLAAARDSAKVRSVWTMDSDHEGHEEIYSLNELGIVRRFSDNLTVIAQSAPSTLYHQYSYWPPVDGDAGLLIMQTRTNRWILFNDRFEWLAETPQLSAHTDWLTFAALDRGPVIVTLGGGTPAVALQLSRRTWIDIVGIYYNDYREFVLAVLFSLAAGLLVMLVYRRRDKRSLRTIAAQKTEIERSHRALQDAQQAIIAAEKFKQARDIAGGFAHEIRNALFPAKTGLHRLRGDETTAKTVAAVERAIDRAINSTNIISTYAHLDDDQSRESVLVDRLLATCLANLADELAEAGVTCSIRDNAPGATTLGNEDQLRLVFENMVRNAVDVLTGQANPHIFVTIVPREQGTEIRIEDTGPGFSDEAKLRAFDAFFTTKPDRGTGLGLTIAQKVVEAHSGTIAIDTTTSGGTVVVWLPSTA